MTRAASPPTSKPRRRYRRLVALAGVALAAPPLAYLTLANLLLNLPHLLDGLPGPVRVEWSRAVSWYPGQARLTGFSLRWQTPSDLGEVTLDAVDVRFAVRELVERRFHAVAVTGHGLELTIRQRGATPPPPAASPSPAQAAARPRRRPRWRLEFPAVTIDGVRRLVIDEQRFVASEGRLEGRFRMTLGGEAEVEHLRLELSEGRLRQAGRDRAGLGWLELEASLRPFTPRRLIAGRRSSSRDAEAWWHFLDARLQLRSPDGDLGFLDHYFRTVPVTLAGRGVLEADLRIAGGHLLPGSSLKIPDGQLELAYLDNRGTGTGWVELQVAESGAELAAHLDAYEIRRRGAERPHLRGRGLTLEASGPPLDLALAVPELTVVLDIPDAEIPDFADWNGFLPASSPWIVTGGAGRFRGRLRLATAERAASGEFELRGRDVAARFGDTEMVGQLVLVAQLRHGDWQSRRFELGGTHLALDGVGVRRGTVGGAAGDTAGETVGDTVAGGDWWADLEMTSGEVVLAEPITVDAELQATLKDSSPIVAFLGSDRRLARRLGRWWKLEHLEASSRFELTADAWRLRDLEIRGRRGLEIHGQLRAVGPRRDALVLLSLGRLAAAAELEGNRLVALEVLRPGRFYAAREPLFWQLPP